MGKSQKSRKSKESLKKRTSSSTIDDHLPGDGPPYLLGLPTEPPCDEPASTEPSKSESISRSVSGLSSSSSSVHALPARQGWPLPPGLPLPKTRHNPNPRPQMKSHPNQGRSGGRYPRSSGHNRGFGFDRQMPPRGGSSDYAPRYAMGAGVDAGANWSRHGGGMGNPGPFGMVGYPDYSAGPGISQPSPTQMMLSAGSGEIGSTYPFQDLPPPHFQQHPHSQQQHYQQHQNYHYQQQYHQRQQYQLQYQLQQQQYLMDMERAASHDYPSPRMQTEYPRVPSTGTHRPPLDDQMSFFGPSASQLHHIDSRLQRHEAQLSSGTLRADAPVFVPTEEKAKKELVYPFIVHG